jgi:uncharacterized protein (DUF427 family)
MRAIWHGQVLADSDRTIEVDGYVYFPRESVQLQHLRPSPKTASDRQCPHGVQFYDVASGQRQADRNAWSYEKPRGSMQQVDHWFGFWDEVEVLA